MQFLKEVLVIFNTLLSKVWIHEQNCPSKTAGASHFWGHLFLTLTTRRSKLKFKGMQWLAWGPSATCWKRLCDTRISLRGLGQAVRNHSGINPFSVFVISQALFEISFSDINMHEIHLEILSKCTFWHRHLVPGLNLCISTSHHKTTFGNSRYPSAA